jgi:hypothetical protein
MFRYVLHPDLDILVIYVRSSARIGWLFDSVKPGVSLLRTVISSPTQGTREVNLPGEEDPTHYP